MDNEAYELEEPSSSKTRSSSNQTQSQSNSNVGRTAVVILGLFVVVCLAGLVAVVAVHIQTGDQLRNEMKESVQELQKVRDELKKAEEKIKTLEDTTGVDKLTEEIKTLRKSLDEKTKTINDLTTQNNKLTSSLQEKTAAVTNLTKKSNELTKSLQEKTAELDKAISEKAALTTDVNQAKEKIGDLQKNNSALETHASKLTTDLNNAKSKVTELENNIESKIKMKSCNGATFDDIPTSMRNATGGEIVQEIPGTYLFIKSYCDVTTDGGSWTVFQRRMDGSVDFLLNWADYVTGFGSLRGEFWLGLETIHQLTKSGDQELRVEMVEEGTGIHYYAKYSTFKVGPASDNYRLTADGYSGNATNALEDSKNPWGIINNQQFTTKDRDHDQNDSENCAAYWKSGGWWFNKCFMANLNGKYGGKSTNGILWSNLNDGRGMNLEFTEMKFRRKN